MVDSIKPQLGAGSVAATRKILAVASAFVVRVRMLRASAAERIRLQPTAGQKTPASLRLLDTCAEEQREFALGDIPARSPSRDRW